MEKKNRKKEIGMQGDSVSGTNKKSFRVNFAGI